MHIFFFLSPIQWKVEVILNGEALKNTLNNFTVDKEIEYQFSATNGSKFIRSAIFKKNCFLFSIESQWVPNFYKRSQFLYLHIFLKTDGGRGGEGVQRKERKDLNKPGKYEKLALSQIILGNACNNAFSRLP